ncbi:hypothetical protein GDO78_016735 [Eleutherodactylus coqui]|uniref:Uncharacterized protein n=1 Tax=Eleutherodactylus coqui TaxID=57060 RepID=A0A8J6B979_ELECQ|nr:hypothetical protein GDO78_016735 [Eleutherodactylus coqui]
MYILYSDGDGATRRLRDILLHCCTVRSTSRNRGPRPPITDRTPLYAGPADRLLCMPNLRRHMDRCHVALCIRKRGRDSVRGQLRGNGSDPMMSSVALYGGCTAQALLCGLEGALLVLFPKYYVGSRCYPNRREPLVGVRLGDDDPLVPTWQRPPPQDISLIHGGLQER